MAGTGILISGEVGMYTELLSAVQEKGALVLLDVLRASGWQLYYDREKENYFAKKQSGDSAVFAGGNENARFDTIESLVSAMLDSPATTPLLNTYFFNDDHKPKYDQETMNDVFAFLDVATMPNNQLLKQKIEYMFKVIPAEILRKQSQRQPKKVPKLTHVDNKKNKSPSSAPHIPFIPDWQKNEVRFNNGDIFTLVKCGFDRDKFMSRVIYKDDGGTEHTVQRFLGEDAWFEVCPVDKDRNIMLARHVPIESGSPSFWVLETTGPKTRIKRQITSVQEITDEKDLKRGIKTIRLTCGEKGETVEFKVKPKDLVLQKFVQDLMHQKLHIARDLKG